MYIQQQQIIESFSNRMEGEVFLLRGFVKFVKKDFVFSAETIS